MGTHQKLLGVAMLIHTYNICFCVAAFAAAADADDDDDDLVFYLFFNIKVILR